MSHFKERKEKNCLNCNAEVLGRFCQVCGQENIEPKESFWHLVTHFFYDITHFDGKFFNTVKYLLLKPGFLTYEYARGKRTTYLHPIRMYVFTSAFFFLIFFSFISPSTEPSKKGLKGLKEDLSFKQQELNNLKEMEKTAGDSVLKSAVTKAIANYDKEILLLTDSISKLETKANAKKNKDNDEFEALVIEPSLKGIKDKVDSISKAVEENSSKITPRNNDSPFLKSDTFYRGEQADSTLHSKANKKDKDTLKNNKDSSDDILDFEFYKDEVTYLAVQKELPPGRQDGYLKRSIVLKLLHWHDQQKKGGEKAFATLKDKLKHSFPTILFISLPIFAFLLKLLYVRRKQFFYADHGIFAIHTYCATFILLLLYYLFDAIGSKLGWWILYFIKGALAIYIIYYTYKAMRNFYEQGRFKTFMKYLFLSLTTCFVMGFLVLIFFVISAYNS